MRKHTPGPWHYFETLDGRCRVKPLNGKYIVAECSAMEPQCEEQRANARLMAAGPDLLEALKGLLRWMPIYPAAADAFVGGREAHQAAIDAARAAIAKAEGSA